MAKKTAKVDHSVSARKALDGLWNEMLLRGRCWGLKSIKENPYAGTNITLAAGDHLVTISYHKGQLTIHEFVRAQNTALGNKVRGVLKSSKIPI